MLRLASRTALMVGGMVLAEELQQQANGGTNVQHRESRASGSESLMLNGKRFTDVVGGAMGTSCDLQSPCPEGYACSNITGSVAICVPAGQSPAGRER